MLKKILQHPVLQHSQDISDLCQPLRSLQITYFCHVRIDAKDNFSAISNHPEFHKHYLQHNYHNVDIHMANTELGKWVIWDAIDCCGESEKMNKESEEFGIYHTFTIIEKNRANKSYYHFSTDKPGKSINQEYLNNLELLRLFILYFHEKVSTSRSLSSAYDIHFSLEHEASGFEVQLNENHFIDNEAKSLFLKKIKMHSCSLIKELTLREIEILSWLHRGKTFNQIAEILNISEVTIKKHIANIKHKTQCYTQFQLGEFFSQFKK